MKAKKQPVDPLRLAYNAVTASPAGVAALATASKLSQPFLDVVSGPILSVWAEVAYDASQLEGGGRISYQSAVEVCIDADRLWWPTSVPNPKDEHACKRFERRVLADATVVKAIAVHGYPKVLRYLGNKLKLGY